MKTFLRSHRHLSLAAAVLTLAGPGLRANEALHWNEIAVSTTTRALPLDPVSESRILAIVHLAMHDAANATHPRFASYGAATTDFRGASFDAAIAAAAHATLAALLPEHAPEFNFWRPATAIREQGHSEWLSYLPTPPVPDYPSTHTRCA